MAIQQRAAVVAECQPSFGEPAHDLRINAVFLGQHPRGQRGFVVVGQYGHNGLQNRRSAVELLGDEMYRGTVLGDAEAWRAATP